MITSDTVLDRVIVALQERVAVLEAQRDVLVQQVSLMAEVGVGGA